MVLTTYLAKEFEHTQEREMFSELVSKLKPVFKDSEGVLVGNFSCEGEEIDAALFKDDAIIIIEMKDYSGKIEGGEEGVWKAGGTELKNPYQQARKYKFALLKKLDKEKEQIFGRQKLESIDLGHISTVIVFRGDIEYNKKEQMPGKTWIWFFVTDIKRVNEQIRQITSPKLRTMVSEREKILKVLRIEDSMIYYKDYRTRIKKTWEKIEKKPDDFETAKEANRVFKEILEETNDDELKLICRHGIALTTENRTDCITILLSIYNEVKDYIGYGKHKLLNDIFTEYEQYFHWEGDEFRDKLLKLFYKLKQNNQIKEIRELFFTDTDTTDKLNLEVGEFLLENNPDDTEVLEIMVINYYLPTYLLGKGDESSRLPIEKLLLKKPEFVEFIIEGELGFPESDFVEIIEKLKQTNAVPLPKLNTWLADFFWMEFSLEISKEKETWMSIGKLYLEAIDEAHQHNMDDKEYLYNALSWFNLHVGIDEKKLKAEQDISFVKECRNITENISMDILKKQNLEEDDFSLLISAAKKLGDRKKDISFLEKVIETALRKYPEDIELNFKIGQIYEEQKQKDKAIECFEHGLENKKFADDYSYLFVEGITVEDLDMRYKLKEEQKAKKETGKCKMWEGGAENSFKQLLNLYFEKGEYEKIIKWGAWLEKQRISNVKEYLAPTYIKLGETFVKEYTPYLEKEEEKKEERKREEKEKIMRPTLKDFALSPDIKKEIDFILHKIKKEKCPDSILLYGPPGCGKTELAKCIAGELGFEYDEIRCSDVLSKWVGESEKNIREFFEKLRENKKGVLFIDEFESFGSERSKHQHGWEHAQSSEMLQQIEKTLKCENTQILIIAATNLLEGLDKAMIRRGRFNHHIPLGTPDLNVREEIFKIKLNNLKNKGRKISSKLDHNRFAKETEGATGADVHKIVFSNIDWVLFERKEEDADITNGIVLEAIKKEKQDKKNKQDEREKEFQPQYQ